MNLRTGLRAAGAVLAACATVCVAVLAGCAPGAPKRTTVEFWQPFEASRYDSVIARFERANPALTVHVRTIEAGAMRDSIAAALASGALPDLCVLDSTTLPALLEHGDLSDWSAGVADLRDSLVGWESCSVGDALYGMPWLAAPRLLVYDHDRFVRAGLDPAEVLSGWEAFSRASAKLRRVGGMPVMGFARDGLFAACLPALAADDSVRWDDDERVLALEAMVRLRAQGMVGTQDSLERAFESGTLAVIAAGPAFARRIAGRPHVGIAPLPGLVTPATCLVLASFARSRHKEAALRFARALDSDSEAVELADRFPDWVPARRVAPAGTGAGALFASQVPRAWFAPATAAEAARRAVLEAAFAASLLQGTGVRASLAAAQASLDSLAGVHP
ncbi:MAG: carbohydrate ABC transporter substrate-binding protein [Candidatus Eisenbacteria bacterium]|uniref:Carbohydrate ABC transporter substrate-binding protein n=1 Tax=Eiseniibacteriota bacterium TaxID=2212470 RepID=A0A933SE93_UNCEI|nr:carbohydrate ABC transporter substrate-binding protein [Candidatus Eisenbacteria bacterium]